MVKLMLDNKFIGRKEELTNLYGVITSTIYDGESNSILVLGPKGVGKTRLVSEVLKKLETDTIFAKSGRLVCLNGLLETDDCLALKEITRQLGLEDLVQQKFFRSFSDQLYFMLKHLRLSSDSNESDFCDIKGKKLQRIILFVLEEFDLFLSHHNQTLLYNLFDVTQSNASIPICVVGISARLDAVEGLEKRVKSRFSHRQLYIQHFESFSEYLNAAGQLLESFGTSESDILWNKKVIQILTDENSDLHQTLKSVFVRRKDFAQLKQVLRFCAANVEALNSWSKVINDEFYLYHREDQLQILDLNLLELCLIVAANHLHTIYEGHSFNFEMVFHQYYKFVSRKCQMLKHERSVIIKAWESLIDSELLTPIDKSSSAQKEYKYYSLQIQPETLMKSLALYRGLPTAVADWANLDVQ